MTTLLHKERIGFLLLGSIFLLCMGLAVYTEQYAWAAIPFLLAGFSAAKDYPGLFFSILLVSLPFSMEFSFSSTLGTDLPDEPLMILISMVSLAMWISQSPQERKAAVQHPLIFLLVVLLIWMILSVCFSTRPFLSFKYMLAKGWYIGAFILAPLLLWRNTALILRSAAVLLASMGLVTSLVVMQHAGYGFRFAMVNEAVSPFFRNHVNYGAMLALCIPLCTAAILICKNHFRRRWLYSLLLLMLVALFFSYSRGAWLALLAGGVAWLLLRKKMLVAGFILAVFLLLAGFVWLKENDRYLRFAHDYKTTIFHKNFGEHLIATYKLRDVSAAERYHRWIAGVRMIGDRPLTGFGPASFYENYKPYTIPAFKTWVSNNPDHSTVHNYFLLTAIEQGLPGLFFLLLLLGGIFYFAQRVYHRSADPSARIIAATTGVIITIFIVLNFLSDLMETDKAGSIFFLTIAALVIADNSSEKRSDTSPHIQGVS